jgi:class 3 adenylate cyclase
LSKAQNANADPFWILATLGECALNLNDMTEAELYYRKAYQAAPRRFGDLNSTRRHARWLLSNLGKDPSVLEQWLPIPTIVVFAGHMIDAVDRNHARFPERLADAVLSSIHHWLGSNYALVGYSSAASGADILFQEALQKLGGESHIILPYDASLFESDSVQVGTTNDWSKRFRAVLAGATSVITASQQKMSAGGISYDYANLMLLGLATIRAQELGKTPVGLCVWDGRPGDGEGGTASVVSRWRQLRVPVERIDLASLPKDGVKSLPVVRDESTPPINELQDVRGDTRLLAMLFGDAVNFSKLTEDQIPKFIQHFLGPIAALLRRKYADANIVRNTWGDGLYLVFDSVREAGRCALDICEFVNDQVEHGKWPDVGLPAELNVRLALHSGPAYRCEDPVTGQINYTGTHVSRAARLEPRTPPGEVYASEAFAALAAIGNISDFTCEYVKQLDWAKHYGSFPTYVVRRMHAGEPSDSECSC